MLAQWSGTIATGQRALILERVKGVYGFSKDDADGIKELEGKVPDVPLQELYGAFLASLAESEQERTRRFFENLQEFVWRGLSEAQEQRQRQAKRIMGT